MTKLLYILSMLLLISSCNKKEKEIKPTIKYKIDLEIFKNNKVFPKIFTTDNYIKLKTDSIIENGNYVGIFKDSIVAFIGAFKNSKPEGLFHFYYFSGKIRATRFYENGLENGPFTYWDEMGYMDECGNKKNGELDGIHYTWWDSRTLRSRTHYENGKLDGINCYYHKNGKIDWIQQNKNDKSNGEFKRYYDNEKLKEIGKYQAGYEIGTWKEFYQNGNVKSLRYFTTSLGNKEQKRMNTYKNTMAEGNISFPVKVWGEYDSIGNIKSKTYYDNSFNITRKDEFYPSGKLFKKTCYNGEVPYMCSRNPGYKIKNGKFEEFYSDGKIKTIGFYTNNTKQGVWKSFDNSGKIIKTDKFKNDTLITK